MDRVRNILRGKRRLDVGAKRTHENVERHKEINNYQYVQNEQVDINLSAYKTNHRSYNPPETSASPLKRLHKANDDSAVPSSKRPKKNIAAKRMQDIREQLRQKVQLLKPSTSKHADVPPKQRSLQHKNTPKAADVSSSSSLQNEEEMEWEPIDEGQVVQEIHEVRKHLPSGSERLSVSVQNIMNKQLIRRTDGRCETNILYVVVDTNIFLANLQLVKELLNVRLRSNVKLILAVPWMVIQELDYIKDGPSRNQLNGNARKAIAFINNQLTSDSSSIKCQTVLETLENNSNSKNADDDILFCSVKLNESTDTIVLSNDTNLRNKSLIHNCKAYSARDIIGALTKEYADDCRTLRIVCDIQNALFDLCNVLIRNELEQAFGKVWKRMRFATSLNDIKDCLKCFKHHWQCVFSMSLQKQCLKVINDFHEFLLRDKIEDETDFNCFIEFCFSLCVYLKHSYTDFHVQITDTINTIKRFAETQTFP